MNVEQPPRAECEVNAERPREACDWLDIVLQRYRRGNSILFIKTDEIFAELSSLLAAEPRKTVVLWALGLAEETVNELGCQYPDNERPRGALAAARSWAAGNIKMPEARPAILACHAAARDMPNESAALLCHAVGQACSVVHTVGHALGYPSYELTAITRRVGVFDCREQIEARVGEYIERLHYWRAHTSDYSDWAKFLR